MGRFSKESYNWAAGSYVDLFVISAITQVLFGISLYWMVFQSPNLVGGTGSAALFYSSNFPLLAVGTLSLTGWMMAIILGIGFDRFPLDFKTSPFDSSTISTIATMNIFGQILIIAGIISSDLALIKQLGMMGATLLGMQLILIGPIAWRLADAREPSLEDRVGLWTIGPSLALPVVGMLTILVWLLGDNDWFYNLYWTVVLDGFWLMLAFGLILSHLQNRLDWKLMNAKITSKAFTIFVILALIHIILDYLFHTGRITSGAVQASIAAPILWIYFVSRPDRIWKNVFAGKKCSAQVLSSHSWLLVTAIIGIYGAVCIDRTTDMFYTRFMLLFGIVAQAIWGTAIQLHDDHKYINIEDRKQRYVSIVMMTIVMFGVIYLALNAGGDIDVLDSNLVAIITVIAVFIASLEFLFWIITDVFMSQKEWHRIPMFYGNKHRDESPSDPYFPSESE